MLILFTLGLFISLFTTSHYFSKFFLYLDSDWPVRNCFLFTCVLLDSMCFFPSNNDGDMIFEIIFKAKSIGKYLATIKDWMQNVIQNY